jgi:hypothetical protein
VEQTKNGRDINRHNYSLDEIAADINKPVVQRLLRLMEFRNTYPAFDGTFVIEDAPDDQLVLSWLNNNPDTAGHGPHRRCESEHLPTEPNGNQPMTLQELP